MKIYKKYILKLIIYLFMIFFSSCSTENCKINYELNSEKYKNALSLIFDMNLSMNSNNTYYRPILTIHEDDNLIDSTIFDEIEFIECHEDGTIIFQAYNCNPQNDFRDVVYILAYSSKGLNHIEGKRNIGKIINVDDNWYLCEHIYSLAV
jgi:hypothetical protein